ncbi:TIGR04222 domain-containing membrane protein [Thermocatellispora tengchongensis]|uniref:TIGR04222 domain-containing membrane protein n=1 Tax=Thermocatellispora tengchongensis TaxID=1073253 RepID=UPI003641463B
MQASYLVAVALAVLVGVLLPPMLCYRGLLAWRASRPRDPELDAYELAWLAAGWRRAVDVAAVGLVAKDVLRRSRSRTYTRVAGTSLSGAHPLEESLAGFAGARPGGSSQRELEQARSCGPYGGRYDAGWSGSGWCTRGWCRGCRPSSRCCSCLCCSWAATRPWSS